MTSVKPRLAELADVVGQLVPDASLMRTIEELRPEKTDTVNSELCMIRDVLLAAARDKNHSLLEAAQLFVWEKLNVGHWSLVDVGWRRAYALTTLLRVTRLLQTDSRPNDGGDQDQTRDVLVDVIRMLDMGFLMGYPVMDNVCCRLAGRLQRLAGSFADDVEPAISAKKARLDTTRPSVPPAGPFIRPVPRVDDLPIEDFIERYKLSETPVVVARGLADWPALGKWSLDYLKEVCGFRSVPVEMGSRYTDGNWTQKIITVNEFVDKCHLPSGGTQVASKVYLAQHDLLEQVPELADDIIVPEYCYSGQNEHEEPAINVWFGPTATVSPLHTDPKHNFLCQVAGEKYLRLYRRDQNPKLYAHEDEMLNNTSQVDLEDVDVKRFPSFESAEGFECFLQAGEMLYIPPKCWHFVKSLSPSMSVSFWFE